MFKHINKLLVSRFSFEFLVTGNLFKPAQETRNSEQETMSQRPVASNMLRPQSHLTLEVGLPHALHVLAAGIE
jgi:hypothetical protein